MPHHEVAAVAAAPARFASASLRRVAQPFLSLWVCISFAIAMLVAAAEPRAAVRSDDHAHVSDHGSPIAAVVEPEPEPEPEDASETPTAISDLPPISAGVVDPPRSSATIDLRRPSISTGLGRGPPR